MATEISPEAQLAQARSRYLFQCELTSKEQRRLNALQQSIAFNKKVLQKSLDLFCAAQKKYDDHVMDVALDEAPIGTVSTDTGSDTNSQGRIQLDNPKFYMGVL